jgi:hypothetical protein
MERRLSTTEDLAFAVGRLTLEAGGWAQESGKVACSECKNNFIAASVNFSTIVELHCCFSHCSLHSVIYHEERMHLELDIDSVMYHIDRIIRTDIEFSELKLNKTLSFQNCRCSD